MKRALVFLVGILLGVVLTVLSTSFYRKINLKIQEKKLWTSTNYDDLKKVA
ncbi:MAG: hypothetical protein ISS71_08895 [Phycisphaerae bacterium]|nr:hypothetical protein [Phycisphaerae bacterium]